MTRFDTARSNEFEVPAVGLDAEHYTSYELGVRVNYAGLSVEGAGYYTSISDQIQRLLTGAETIDGEQIVTKANVGDGELYGIEIKFDWALSSHWLAYGHYAWLDGEITAEAQSGQTLEKGNHSRMMPSNYRAGLRYRSQRPNRWWVESELSRVADADQLSVRDIADTQRIPPGGTPGYTLWHLRGGFDISAALAVNLALENLSDENYRVHGSGQNEPGRNFIVAIEYAF